MKHSLVFFGYAVASLGLAFIALLLYISFCIPDCSRAQSSSAQKTEWLRQVPLVNKSRYRLLRIDSSFENEQGGNKKTGILRRFKSPHHAPDTKDEMQKIYFYDKPVKSSQAGAASFHATAD